MMAIQTGVLPLLTQNSCGYQDACRVARLDHKASDIFTENKSGICFHQGFLDLMLQTFYRFYIFYGGKKSVLSEVYP